MLMWLVAWRQSLLMLLLVLMVGLTVLPSNPSVPAKEILAAGWWVEQEQHAHLNKRVAYRRVSPPDKWLRFWLVWQGVQSGFWLGVTSGLLWSLDTGLRAELGVVGPHNRQP